MSNVYPIGQTSQYLLSRAARRRREGRYDKAMALLTKAKDQLGDSEDVEIELAQTYDEMGCEDEACRAYLRVVRFGGRHRAQALFSLALTSAQRADLPRAMSYFEAFAVSDRAEVSAQMASLLQKQLVEAMEKPVASSRRARAKALEQRAAQRLREGKFHAAKRTIEHSLRLRETAQGNVLKACCHLVLEDGEEAVRCAKKALLIRPGYIQALCVLVDALWLAGRRDEAKHALFLAASRAKSSDSLFSVAVECAKHGFNALTLILTRRLLGREPFHVRAMAMRACAFVNLGGVKQATRLFGRLCALLPEDSVFDAHYRMLLDGTPLLEPLTLAQDVPAQEAMTRSMKIVTMLSEDPAKIRRSEEAQRQFCRCADWALHSPMAGANVTMMAVIMLSALDTPKTRGVLLDALTDPRLDDTLKRSILQAICAHSDQQPVYADIGGRFSRLAAGASMPTIRGAEGCQYVVQRAANALMKSYPGAAQTLLDMWIAYLKKYGAVKGRMAEACAAALEYAFHIRAGRSVSLNVIALQNGVPARLAARYVRRILKACKEEEQNTTSIDE